eukprot:41278-Prymnesium_polylepis.1
MPQPAVARPPLLPDAQFKRWPWGGCFLAFRTIVMRPSSLDPPSAQTPRAPPPAAAASALLTGCRHGKLCGHLRKGRVEPGARILRVHVEGALAAR